MRKLLNTSLPMVTIHLINIFNTSTLKMGHMETLANKTKNHLYFWIKTQIILKIKIYQILKRLLTLIVKQRRRNLTVKWKVESLRNWVLPFHNPHWILFKVNIKNNPIFIPRGKTRKILVMYKGDKGVKSKLILELSLKQIVEIKIT